MPPNKRKRKKRQLDHNRDADRQKRVQVGNVARRLLGNTDRRVTCPYCEGDERILNCPICLDQRKIEVGWNG